MACIRQRKSVILIVLIVLFTKATKTQPSLPKEIDLYCLNATICSTGPAAPSGDFDDEPCCSACYCGEDCGLYNNCCFDELDIYRFHEKENLTCIFPSTKNELNTPLVSYSFYMVDKCPQSSNTVFPDSNKDCGDVELYAWGSMQPIYSPGSGRIYKNQACASCHGRSDGIEWSPVFECKDADYALNIESYLDMFVAGFRNSSCDIHFVYNGDVNDLLPQKCFKSIVSETNYACFSHFWTSLSADEKREECGSGLMAPVVYENTWYANAYCAACESKIDLSNCKGGGTRKLNSNSFYSILDISLTNTLSLNGNNKVIREQSMACGMTLKGTSDCRPLFCPTGQIRNADGTCRLLSNQWYVESAGFCLKLATNKTKLSDMVEVFESLFSKTFFQYAPPSWTSVWNWEAKEFWYVINDEDPDDVVLEEIILRFNIRNVKIFVDFEEFLSLFQEQFLQPWTISLNHSMIPISPSLMPQCSFTRVNQLSVIRGNLQRVEHIHHAAWFNNLEESDKQNFTHKIYRSGYFYFFTVVIKLHLTKLYFCEQLEYLSQDLIDFGSGIVQTKDTGRLIYQDEFNKISYFGDWKYRVCVHDAGFEPVVVSSVALHCKNNLFTMITIIVIAMLCIE